MNRPAALLTLVAGLMGASGIALAARAAHGGGDANLALAAQFLILHAAALPGLASLGRSEGRARMFVWAGAALALGVCVFSGDLALRALAGAKLFNFAAPIGGSVMILGWLAVAIAGFTVAVERAGADPSGR